MQAVHIQDVTVVKDGTTVLDRLSLHVGAGERMVLLGPSGAGKSTLLRAIAGLDEVAGGLVLLGDRDVTTLPPRERGVAMAAQVPGLIRHLDVGGNLAFPLWVRGVQPEERQRRVEAEAGAFSLKALLRRRPRSLSMGEQHEVALARSLVRQPDVLLLDEPLAQADAPRRAQLLQELRRLQEGAGATLLVATNDQRVAMALAERCAVLHRGRIVQVDTPTQLFERPGTSFVAGFLGSPPMNLLPGRIERLAGRAQLLADPVRVDRLNPRLSRLVDQACTVGLRPSDLHPARPGDLVVIEEVVQRVAFLGSHVEVELGSSPGGLLAVLERPAPRIGELLRLSAPADRVHVFAPDGQVLSHGV